MTTKDELKRLRQRDALTQRVLHASLKSPRISAAIRTAAKKEDKEDKKKKKEKGNEIQLPDGDLDLLVKIRGDLNKKWKESQKTKKDKKPTKKAFAEGDGEGEEEEAKTKASKQVSAMWLKFLEEVHEKGRERVKNTNPKTKDKNPEVSFSTLFKNDQGFRAKSIKEFKEWLRKGQDSESPSEEKPSAEEEGSDQVEKPSKPKGSGLSSVPTTVSKDLLKRATFRNELSEREKKEILASYKEDLGTDDLNEIIHALGFGEFPGIEDKNLEITMHAGRLQVQFSTGYPNYFGCTREIYFEESGPRVHNDYLRLPPDSPKGTGTRIFATGVAWAKKLGIKKIDCLAYRSDSSIPPFIGYKVWPRLGYDGEIPKDIRESNYMPKSVRECLGDNTTIQALFSCGPEAIAWWDSNGDSFDATFDTDGFSAALFDAYLEKKGGFEGLTESSK